MTTDGVLQKASKSAGLIALGIWIVTGIVGFWLIPTTLDLVMRIAAAFWAEYGFYGKDYWAAVAIRQLSILPLGTLYVALLVGSGEYYYRNYGKPESWKVCARIIAVEIALIVLTAII